MSESDVRIEINSKWCKGCGFCVEFCPKGVLVMRRGLPVVEDLDGCTACDLCEMMCPDFAIKVSGRPRRRAKNKEDVAASTS